MDIHEIVKTFTSMGKNMVARNTFIHQNSVEIAKVLATIKLKRGNFSKHGKVISHFRDEFGLHIDKTEAQLIAKAYREHNSASPAPASRYPMDRKITTSTGIITQKFLSGRTAKFG